MRWLVVPVLAVAALLVVGTAGVAWEPQATVSRPERADVAPAAVFEPDVAPPRAAAANPTASLVHLPHSPEVRALLYHLRHGSNRKRRDVLLELRKLGPGARSAIPELVEFLIHPRDHWGRVRDELAWAIAATGEYGLPAVMVLIQHDTTRARMSALEVLHAMEPGTADPLAHELLSIAGTNRHAVPAIAALGPAGLPPIVELLRRGEVKIPRALYPLGKPGVRAIAPLLFDPDPAVRKRAGEALSQFRRNITVAAPQILDALEDPTFEPGLLFLTLVPRLGDDAPRAVPALLRRADSLILVGVLAQLGTRAKAALPELRRRLATATDATQKGVLAAALVAIEENDEPVKQRRRLDEAGVRAALRDGTLAPKHAIVFAGKSPALARHLRTLITEPTEDQDEMLTAMGAPALTTLPAIIELIESHAWQEVNKGIANLRHHPERVRALPTLAKRLNKWAVHDMLQDMGPEAAPILRDLIRAIRGDEPNRRAIETLGFLGAAARPALPALRYQRRNERPRFRLAAILAVWKITGDPRDLRRAFRDPTWTVRKGAAKAVRDAEHAPELIDLLRDRKRSVRRAAMEALKRIGPHAAAEPELRRIANDEDADEDDRRLAREALTRPAKSPRTRPR